MNRELHIIWDLDGTLIDSKFEVLDNLNIAIQRAGFGDIRRLGNFRIGPTLDIMLQEAYLDQLTPDMRKAIIRYFRDSYDNCDFSKTVPFRGVDTILSDLSNYTHHVVTNKPDYPAIKIIDRLRWRKFISTLLTPYTFNDRYFVNKSELFNKIINIFRFECFVSVGDMRLDIKAANDNGIFSIGVLWGNGTETEFRQEQCCSIVKSVNDLFCLLSDIREKLL